jgi:hypothetical protein
VLLTWEPEETIYQAYFYYECSKQDWNSNSAATYSCYKYKQFYTFDDGDPTWPEPRFRVTVQAFGPGFGPNNYQSCNPPCTNHGYPTYNAEWRVDTDAPGTSNDYTRWKKADNTWESLSCPGTPCYKENRYIDRTNSGQQWRTVDKDTGWFPSFGIDPTEPSGLPVDADVTIMPNHPTEDDPSSPFSGANTGDFAFDRWIDSPNPESIYNVDIVIWYRGMWTADASHCVIGFPCKIESNWIPNSGW